MARYIFHRLVTMVVVAWVIVTLTFFLLRLLPGGPFLSERGISESIMRNLEAKYQLDKPWWQQYMHYLGNVLVWDLGPSIKYQGRTVNEIINTGLPVSASLGGISLLVSVGLGLPLGIASALRHNGALDRTTQALVVLTAAAPSFVIAALLQYFVAFKLRWLPVAGAASWQNMVLPILALCSYTLAWVVKLSRSTLLEVMNQDYIRTARAKGLPGTLVVWRHMLKNALVPVIASLAPIAAGLLVGSFIIERIFAIPGIGREFVTSISNRDYTTTLGVTLFFGLLMTALTLAADILTALLDPKVRLDKEG